METKNNDWKIINLGEILDKEDIKQVLKLVKSNDMKAVRLYLNSIKEKLLKKDILPDYLYYCLLNEFQKRGMLK